MWIRRSKYERAVKGEGAALAECRSWINELLETRRKLSEALTCNAALMAENTKLRNPPATRREADPKPKEYTPETAKKAMLSANDIAKRNRAKK